MSSPARFSERQLLLDEIASLEAQIDGLTTNFRLRPRSPTSDHDQLKHKRQRGPEVPALQGASLEETIRRLLDQNDSALVVAHPPKQKDIESDHQRQVELQRAYELVHHNAAFTAIEFTSADSHLASSESTHQLRIHYLAGTLPSPHVPLGFRITLHVHEPVPAVPDDGLEAVDPGRDYEVVRMEHEVWGGGEELQRAVHELNLDEQPNPPALFALLRRYSLLGSQRERTMASLREADWDGVEVLPARDGQDTIGDAHRATLEFRAANGAGPTLRLDYPLPSLLADAPPTPPTLMPLISPALSRTLSPEAREMLESIPTRFRELLAEGYGVEEAVTLVVKGCMIV